MKYPKVLRMLTLATALTLAVPCAAVPAHATENRETREEYESRTGYILPEGYEYVLDDIYVILEGDGSPRIQAAVMPGTSAEPEAPEAQELPEETVVSPEASETPAAPEMPGDAGTMGEPETPAAPETPIAPENPANPEEPGTSADPEAPANPTDPDISGDPGNPGDPGSPTDPDISGDPGEPTDPDISGDPEKPEKPETPVAPENPGVVQRPETPAEKEEETPVISLLIGEQPEIDISYLTSEEFKAIRDRIQYNVEVPIEGLPSFITQEMIVGALKAQDETGYPASVTIAQIIQESGFGKYGPGGEDGKGLSYLAYQYCNLFGIKGKGTAGSAFMNTLEMTAAGETYSTKAGFRAYHTYTECIEDRSKLLEEVYSDLTENVTDANTFAMKIGRRWATDINYGKSLIRTMQRYDLYRLDEMTLVDFSKLMGRFANPCPGSSISSTFGYRTFDHSFHKGLDMGTGTENIPTYAAEAGVVTFAGEAGSAGNLIIIDHGDGLVTKYMHHEEIYVEKDQKVEKGQQIGLSGTTGYSTGNHLHFQVEENGRAVDPIKYLQEENTETVKMREKVKVDINKIIENIKQR